MKATKWNWRPALVVVICQFLTLQPLLAAEAGPQPGIRIVVVSGDRARNVIQQTTAETLTVRVEDGPRQAVAGATVVFSAPNSGPGGQFANGSTSLSTTTGTDGLATADGFRANAVPGVYQIEVRAESGGYTAMASIAQTNVESRKKHTRLILIIASIAGAVGAIALAGRRGNVDDTPIITLGGAGVGAPNR
jgi:hypothetical protein